MKGNNPGGGVYMEFLPKVIFIVLRWLVGTREKSKVFGLWILVKVFGFGLLIGQIVKKNILINGF